MIILRDYQEKIIEDTHNHFRTGNKTALINLPTGAGKTLIAGSIIHRTMNKEKRCIFLCNRIELIDQTALSFKKLGITAGIIAAGYPHNYALPIQIASIDTLQRRLEKIPYFPELVIWDECRGICAPGWTKIYSNYQKCFHIGLDATPERADGKPLAPYFSTIIQGPTVLQLIEMGFLAPPCVYSCPPPDLSSVSQKFGDFDTYELAEVMNKPKITGSSIDHYYKYGTGRSGIIFCVNVKHSIEVSLRFRDAGINCVHLDGDTHKDQRKETIDAYRAGEINLLSNVGLFCAGFDVPRVGYIGDLAATMSISRWLQKCGRGSRPDEGKVNYIYSDHAGNIYRHNMMPHDDRVWSLAGRPKKSKKDDSETKERVFTCDKCWYTTMEPFIECPDCGYEKEKRTEIPKEHEGELQQVDPLLFRRQQKMEERECVTYDDFVKLGKQRGYKPGWAKIRWEIKSGSR